MNLIVQYPNLENMMSSYFHQDYELGGPDDLAILRSYAEHRQAGSVRNTISEIRQLLAGAHDGLLHRFEDATGHGNMMIGETDAGATEWLRIAALTLEKALEAR